MSGCDVEWKFRMDAVLDLDRHPAMHQKKGEFGVHHLRVRAKTSARQDG
jgi:hypothetical protein